MTLHSRGTPTQIAIIEAINAAHIELQMMGYDQKMGQEGVYVRDPDLRITGSDVFGYDANRDKKVIRVMYPEGWAEAIGRETKALARKAAPAPPLDDDEPPL